MRKCRLPMRWLLGLTVGLLGLSGVPAVSACPDVRWCHCDAQQTLHCLTSDPVELRAITDQLRASPGQVRLADLVLRNITQLPGGLFQDTRLHGLLLSGSRARHLPADLLQGLEPTLLALGLGENRLSDLPDATLRSLVQLERLDLSGNQLRSVPTSALPTLTRLVELNLGDNQIERLQPGAFVSLARLRNLHLDGNQLSTDQLTAGGLQGLQQLEQLSLARNQLTGELTPDFLPALPSLTRLNLAQNQLTSVLPGALRQLTTLLELDLSQNRIDVISERGFWHLGQLQTLRLDMNRVVTLPAGAFDGAKSLASLDLSHNALQSVTSEAFASLANLRELYVRDNDIISLEGDLLSGLPALKRLDLSENPLHCDCRLRGLAEYLTSMRTRLLAEDLTQVTCMTPPRLENAPLISVMSDQLTCEDELVQYDDVEVRPSDASHQIRLEAAHLTVDGSGVRLTWRVDPALTPYRCDQVFVFQPRHGHEEHVASVSVNCASAGLVDPTRLPVAVRWPRLAAGATYRFCLVLVELAPQSSATLRPSCGELVTLAMESPPTSSQTPSVLAPPAELSAFFANMTTEGRVAVFLRVSPPVEGLEGVGASDECALGVTLFADGELLQAEEVSCSVRQLSLAAAAGRPAARVCVSAPYRTVRLLAANSSRPLNVSHLRPPVDGAAGPAAVECVSVRPAAGRGRAVWWQAAAAVVATLLLLALLAAVCLLCRLPCPRSKYNKWAGRPGVNFVRTATQPRSASEENIHSDHEETDSQM